jgi:hypothetical protein
MRWNNCGQGETKLVVVCTRRGKRGVGATLQQSIVYKTSAVGTCGKGNQRG